MHTQVTYNSACYAMTLLNSISPPQTNPHTQQSDLKIQIWSYYYPIENSQGFHCPQGQVQNLWISILGRLQPDSHLSCHPGSHTKKIYRSHNQLSSSSNRPSSHPGAFIHFLCSTHSCVSSFSSLSGENQNTYMGNGLNPTHSNTQIAPYLAIVHPFLWERMLTI